MKTVLIGCCTLEAEISSAIRQTGWEGHVCWLRSGLHDNTDLLHDTVQRLIDNSQEYDRILLAMGTCGNSVIGLHSGHAELVFPHVDDCITLLCGSRSKRAKYYHSYFFTEGWLHGERTIWHEYLYTVDKYGKETARSIFDVMLRHYRSCIFLDTHCGNTAETSARVRRIAENFHLDYERMDGTLRYLRALLSGPWDAGAFVIIPPHTTITHRCFAPD